MISAPMVILLTLLIARRGANLGVSALWVVVAFLCASIGMFFVGRATVRAPQELPLFARAKRS